VWSPDGASLLFPGGVEIPVDGSPPTQLPVDDPRSQYVPTYSPNGAEIAYISWDGLGGLVVAAADGSQARVLIPGARTHSLVWSPTGDRIAFASPTSAEKNGRHGPPTELAVLDVASGSVVTGPDMGPAGASPTIKFSPEGDQILFTRTGPKGVLSSLWSVHADGSDPHQLVAGTGEGDWQTVPTP
jgi:Tol biopolymer transport system component